VRVASPLSMKSGEWKLHPEGGLESMTSFFRAEKRLSSIAVAFTRKLEATGCSPGEVSIRLSSMDDAEKESSLKRRLYRKHRS
uniref:BACK domain-containing protein n=1 Tax=Parascaris univalens TaxID=6257 RepID=A0A914ZGH5_PARUN